MAVDATLVVLFLATALDAEMIALERKHLRETAATAAEIAQDRYLATGSTATASDAARTSANGAHAGLVSFRVLDGGATEVVVSGTARSYVGRPLGLGRLFHLQVSGTAAARSGPPQRR
jgi:hypothetical protein